MLNNFVSKSIANINGKSLGLSPDARVPITFVLSSSCVIKILSQSFFSQVASASRIEKYGVLTFFTNSFSPVPCAILPVKLV